MKPGKKTAPMSYITGIRPSSKHLHRDAKRYNGVVPKYGVQPTPANAEQLAEVSQFPSNATHATKYVTKARNARKVPSGTL